MLILIFGALALWLWIPAHPASKINAGSLRRLRDRGAERHTDDDQVVSTDARIIRELSALLRSGLDFHPAVDALLEAEDDSGNIIRALKDLQATHRLSNSAPGPGLPAEQGQGPAVRRLHWCLELSERSGASLADVLERLAEDLECALVAQQAFEAAMAGPKATTKLLTWLPLVGFGFGLLVGIDVLGTIGRSWAAQLSVLIGALLWIANRIWCRKLMQATTSQALS
ncbi:type II secretion system F family protein [Glutamicibacter sp. Je.9.36]|uniref:type II secretion system F family protein n=1 Tax=Glutamicibacter sp. Je.9.36 TaxID=3142837 RepID=UPI003DA7B42E